MLQTLSNQELDEILSQVCYDTPKYYYPAAEYFQDLYYTGCRSTELLQIEKWNYSNTELTLTTHKTQAVRKFDIQKLSVSFAIALAEKIEPYDGLTYRQLTDEFRRLIKFHPIYAGDRIADTYLFRYNRARQIFAETNSLTQVMLFFQWNSESIASKYITQPLTFEPHNRFKP